MNIFVQMKLIKEPHISPWPSPSPRLVILLTRRLNIIFLLTSDTLTVEELSDAVIHGPHLMLTWPVFSYLAILTFSMGNTQTCSRCLIKTRHQLCIFTNWSRYWHMFTLFCRCNQLLKKHPNFTTCLTRKPNTKRTNWNFYPVVVQIRWAKLEETFSLLSNSLQ